MDTARCLISGREISARAALEDRDAGWARFRGFLCCHCNWPAGLRRRGRGENPFFFHYAHSPRSCPLTILAAEDLKWIAAGNISARGKSLADVLLADIGKHYAKALSSASPRKVDNDVARFLAHGMQIKQCADDDNMGVLVSNMLQILYRPQYIVLLRWICFLVAESGLPKGSGESGPFWEVVQEAFLDSDIAISWLERASPDRLRITRVPPPSMRLDSCGRSNLNYSSYYANMKCLKLGDSRVDVAEICKYPTTLSFTSDSDVEVTMSIVRCQPHSSASVGDLTLHPGADRPTKLVISKPEAIIVSPHYQLQDKNILMRPFLYLFPGSPPSTNLGAH